MKNKDDQLASEPDIGIAIDRFATNVDACVTSLDMAMLMIVAQFEVRKETFQKYLKAYGTPKKDEDGEEFYELEKEHAVEADKLQDDLDKAAVSCDVVPESLFVSLISQYDAFLGKLLRSLFLLRPELLKESERRFTFPELVQFGSIEKAREHLLEKEVEAVLRKSHSDQFDWMENKFKIPLRKDLPSWPRFIEITERRNLFVHCDGVVSGQYLDVCKVHQVKFDQEINVGNKLTVSREYFRLAYRCVFEIGLKLGQVLWRKLREDQIEMADKNIADLTYKLLRKNHNHMACNLLDFACSLPRHASECNRRLLVINRAQAYKWRGDVEQCKKILDAEDWSACGLTFALCIDVLRDKFIDAVSKMKRIGKNGEVKEHDYKTWPVFKKFRKSNDFLIAFSAIFGRSYAEIQKPPKSENYSKSQ